MKIGAAVASLFISGGGQFIRGRLARGFLFVALDGLALVAMVVFMRSNMPFLAPIGVSMLLHVVAAIDAARGPDGARPLPIGAVAGLLCALGLAPIVLALVTRVFLVEAFKIPAGSMIPTLEVGDHIFVDKRVDDWSRGDVVVFAYPKNPRVDFVKRAVAFAGDTVELRGTDLFINGAQVPHVAVPGECSYDDFFAETGVWQKHACRAFDETLRGKTYRVIYDPADRRRDAGPFTVGLGEFFVLGDNRDNSHDSRYFGNIPLANLRGRALSIWFSSGPNGMRVARHGLHIQ